MTPPQLIEPPLEAPLARVIYYPAEIAQAVQKLAAELLAATPSALDLKLLVVLEGARRFGEDLFKAMVSLPQCARRSISFTTIGASSYGCSTVSTGKVRIFAEPAEDFQGRSVVIVDDILDRGHTLECLKEYCRLANPASLRTCVLFAKRDVSRDFVPDFVGLEVPPVFVVGYGLDYQEKFRNLPYLAALDEASMSRKVATGVQVPSRQREKA